MKYLAICMAATVMLLAGCSDKPAQPELVQPAPEVRPLDNTPAIPHSTSWIRGYNDGYNGNWLGPANWVVSNEYRAGWSAGNRDKTDGRPHRLEQPLSNQSVNLAPLGFPFVNIPG